MKFFFIASALTSLVSTFATAAPLARTFDCKVPMTPLTAQVTYEIEASPRGNRFQVETMSVTAPNSKFEDVFDVSTGDDTVRQLERAVESELYVASPSASVTLAFAPNARRLTISTRQEDGSMSSDHYVCVLK